MDEAERQGAGSLEPLAIGGGEVTYPDWAPYKMQCIANEASHISFYRDNQPSRRIEGYYTRKVREVEVAEIAASDPRMEKIWKSYRSRFFKKRQVDESDQDWTLLQQEMAQLLRYFTRKRTPWDRTPIGEKRNTLNDALKAIETLENSLELGVWALERFGEQISNLHQAVCKDIYALDTPQIVTRPRAKGASLSSFTRGFCFWHKHMFGLPLYENTAILAGVYLDEQIEVQAVVDSFKPVKDMQNIFDDPK